MIWLEYHLDRPKDHLSAVAIDGQLHDAYLTVTKNKPDPGLPSNMPQLFADCIGNIPDYLFVEVPRPGKMVKGVEFLNTTSKDCPTTVEHTMFKYELTTFASYTGTTAGGHLHMCMTQTAVNTS